ncbi:MAG: hypothetical protein HC819_01885 [Cyclobacteriaceae bacterium]|nr:hypothetical protein [Cyclobacteriaceae bacterium]
MHKYFSCVILIFVFLLEVESAFSQTFNPYQHAYQGWDGDKIKKASPFRAFLNKFSANISIGYGRTFYTMKPQNDVLEGGASLVLLGDYTTGSDTVPGIGIINWLNSPEVVNSPSDPYATNAGQILNADSAEIKYAGSGFNIPFRLNVQFDIDRFRIGGGISYELHGINRLNPKGQGTQAYEPNFNTTPMFRYYFFLGGKVYHLLGWDYNVDVEIGKVKYGNQYNKSALSNGLYFSLGLPLEYEMSEYFWFFVRPAFEFKNYAISVNEGISATSFQYKQPALYVHVGVRMKIPEIKRCPVKSCRTQLKHVHGGQEFRGQPFFKEQNPKIGELYPELEMNKRKNQEKSMRKN